MSEVALIFAVVLVGSADLQSVTLAASVTGTELIVKLLGRISVYASAFVPVKV